MTVRPAETLQRYAALSAVHPVWEAGTDSVIARQRNKLGT